MIRRIPVYQVDAFTARAFRGNSAATCLLSPEHLPLTDSERQLIAAEMNLSETAFVELRQPAGSFSTDSEFNLRWFTPKREVPLCGHATLASAACILNDLGNDAEELVFYTQSGPLKVARTPDVSATEDSTKIALSMSLPYISPDDTLPSSCSSADSPVVKALCQDLKVTDMRYAGGQLKYLLVVCDGTSAEELTALVPDVSRAFKSCQDDSLVGVIVAMQEGGKIFSRFFAPWAGLDEDPVTGSAHSVLGAYFAEKTGETTMQACQVSARQGNLTVKVEGKDTVVLSSHATTIMEGTLLVPATEARPLAFARF